MKLVRFRVQGHEQARLGVLDGDDIRDLHAADPALPDDLVPLIAAGAAGLRRAAQAAERAPVRSAADAVLLAPIPRPPKHVLCVGRNYHEHAAEFSASGFDASERQSIPDHPVIFTKPPTSIVGPGEPIVTANDPTGSVDYEGELAVVIGPGGRGIAARDALRHVYGYTIVNDVTARELQKRHVQWFIGKGLDTFCPMGPCVVTADELPDVSSCRLQTTVNDELRQDAHISQLIFDIPTLIATLSAGMTLEAGDVIATGTPVGAGLGFDPRRYLRSGDIVEVSVSGIGTLRNPVQ